MVWERASYDEKSCLICAHEESLGLFWKKNLEVWEGRELVSCGSSWDLGPSSSGLP